MIALITITPMTIISIPVAGAGDVIKTLGTIESILESLVQTIFVSLTII